MRGKQLHVDLGKHLQLAARHRGVDVDIQACPVGHLVFGLGFGSFGRAHGSHVTLTFAFKAATRLLRLPALLGGVSTSVAVVAQRIGGVTTGSGAISLVGGTVEGRTVTATMTAVAMVTVGTREVSTVVDVGGAFVHEGGLHDVFI